MMCRCIILCDMYMKHWYFVHLTLSADKWIVAYYDSQWNFTKWFTALSGLSKTVDIIVNICMCWWSCLDKNKFYSTLFSDISLFCIPKIYIHHVLNIFPLIHCQLLVVINTSHVVVQFCVMVICIALRHLPAISTVVLVYWFILSNRWNLLASSFKHQTTFSYKNLWCIS